MATQTTTLLKDLWPGFATGMKNVSTAADEKKLNVRKHYQHNSKYEDYHEMLFTVLLLLVSVDRCVYVFC